jgi:Family of unknown function (DUF7033)
MLAIYIDKITARHKYVFDLIFEDYWKIGYQLFEDRAEFENCKMPKLAYSELPVSDEPYFQTNGLLNEKGIKSQKTNVVSWQGLQVFFPIENKSSIFPFDPFALIFYSIVRYEEYLPELKRDRHERFQAENSILFKTGMLQRPVVDILVQKIVEAICKEFPSLSVPKRNFFFTPSYDIDMAFAHLGKGFLRAIGGFAKLFLKLQPKEIRGRVKTLLGFEKDPFDNFDFQQNLHQEMHMHPLYFVNLGDYSRYDKNVSYENEKLQELLKKLAEQSELGVHPSYYSGDNLETLMEEKTRLETIIEKPVYKSRQHFLKMSFPETYQNLIKIGIKEDYSMGYANCFGFRAGTSAPFYFYDLTKETKTELKVFPFAFMDTVFLDHLEVEPPEILSKITDLIQEARDLNIPLIGIWHNYALADDAERLESYQSILQFLKG